MTTALPLLPLPVPAGAERANGAAQALATDRQAVEINSFDPEVQHALAELYPGVGDPARSTGHAAYQRNLRPGGEG